MKKEALSAKQVEHMKPDPSRRLEIPAGPPAGLYLVVHPTGGKSWAFRYRWLGKPKKLTFKDPYPDMLLAAARAEAHAALDELKNGIDPAAEKQAREAEPDTVKAVVDEFIIRRVAGTRTRTEVERILQREIVSTWGQRKIGQIGRADALRVLDGISDRGAEIMANRTLGVLKRLFNWCVERGLVEVSPVAGIRPPGTERSRDRVLTPEELAEIWKAAGSLEYPLCPFFRLLILTAQRRQEVAGMKWENIDHDAAVWTLPAASTKAARVHDVSLSTGALELLASLPRFEKGSYIFTTTSGKQPINGFSKAKSRLDAAIQKSRKETAGTDQVESMTPWTIHDIRRTVATGLAKANVPPHVLALILNHSPGRTQGITAIYNRHRYAAERREALERWSEFVLNLTLPKSAIKAG